jgi:hypothetical protein
MSRVDGYPYELRKMLSEESLKVGGPKALEMVLAKWPEYKQRLTLERARACAVVFRRAHGLLPELMIPIAQLPRTQKTKVLNAAARLRDKGKRWSNIVMNMRDKFPSVRIPEPDELRLAVEAHRSSKRSKRQAVEPAVITKVETGVAAATGNGHFQLVIKGPGVSVDHPISKETALSIIATVWGGA